MMYRRISVIITTYNSSHVIERSLNSIKNQKNIDVEVLVVDDCSLDLAKLSKIIKYYSQEIDILFLPQNKKGNANISRNIGIKNASYDYVAFLDADDTWQPEHLTKCVEKMSKDKASLCFSRVQFNQDNKVLPSSNALFIGEISSFIFNNGVAVTSSIVAKRDALLQCMFDESQFKHQDWEFLIRFEKTFKVCQSEYVGLNYTLSTGTNMSSKFNPAATVRFINNTLPEKYHNVMLLSQLYPMIKQRNSNAIIHLTKELNDTYKYTPNNIGFRIKFYSVLFSKGFNLFNRITFRVLDSCIRLYKKLLN